MKMKKEKDSTILSGIILSFLHLRHLDLRQIQHECFKHINYLVSINRNCSKMIEVFQKNSKIGDLGWFSINVPFPQSRSSLPPAQYSDAWRVPPFMLPFVWVVKFFERRRYGHIKLCKQLTSISIQNQKTNHLWKVQILLVD